MIARGEASIRPRDVSIPVTGGALSARVAACEAPCGAILAIHGGGYTGRYFDAPGQSFLRIAAAAGYWVAAVDRPGYGAMRDRAMPFDLQVALLGDAARWLLGQAGAGLPLFLHGHSIGGMLALLLAGSDSGLAISGLAMTGAGAVNHEKAAAAIRARAASAETHSESTPELRKLLMMGHAFDTLGCHVVGWRTDNFNFASQAAIERLGARKDGVIRGHALRRDGTIRDTVMYSLRSGEWPEVKAQLNYLLDKPRA